MLLELLLAVHWPDGDGAVMETLEVLEKARELIAVPGRWATGWYAYDDTGKKVDPEHEDACRWCVFGAMDRVCGGRSTDDATDALAAACCDLYGIPSFAHVNDTEGHSAALSMFDRAIAKLKERV